VIETSWRGRFFYEGRFFTHVSKPVGTVLTNEKENISKIHSFFDSFAFKIWYDIN